MVFVGSKRRALSTVVTTAIMLTAVAVIGTGIVAWANTNSRNFENILVSSASDKTNRINEMFTIENVQFINNCFPTFLGLSVTVTNVGTVGLNVTKILTSDSTQSQTNTIPNGAPLTPHQSYTYSYCYAWQSNVLTTVQAITARGTTVTTQVMK